MKKIKKVYFIYRTSCRNKKYYIDINKKSIYYVEDHNVFMQGAVK